MFLVWSSICLASPVLFYKTHEDYKIKKSLNVGEFKELYIGNALTSIKVTENGKKRSYENKELEKVWAFEIDGILFKYYKGQIFEFMYAGDKVFVYENANHRINAVNEGKAYTPGDDKYSVLYFSTGIEKNLTLIQTSLKGKIKENLRKTYPQLSNVFDNLEKLYEDRKAYTLQKAVKCFSDFDKE